MPVQPAVFLAFIQKRGRREERTYAGSVYTESMEEYQMLSGKLLEEIPDAELHYMEQDGYFRFWDSDMIVVALDGARGMETVLECSSRYPQAMIVWVTDDEYFARMAIRRHIF